MNRETANKLVYFTGGLLIGGSLGYMLARRRLSAQYEQMVNEEVSSLRDMYKRRYKEAPYSNPTEAANELITPPIEIQSDEEANEKRSLSILDISYTPEELAAIEDAERIAEKEGYSDTPRNPPLFTAIPGEIRPKKARQNRNPPNPFVEVHSDDLVMPEPNPEHPYLITVDQFMEDYKDFDKITIEYYAADDTLADEREQIIPDIEGTIGQENLLRFGHASGDKSIVYVRNERLRVDFEVAYDEGGYAQIVLGMDENFLEHQEKRRPRKMRDERYP